MIVKERGEKTISKGMCSSFNTINTILFTSPFCHDSLTYPHHHHRRKNKKLFHTGINNTGLYYTGIKYTGIIYTCIIYTCCL